MILVGDTILMLNNWRQSGARGTMVTISSRAPPTKDPHYSSSSSSSYSSAASAALRHQQNASGAPILMGGECGRRPLTRWRAGRRLMESGPGATSFAGSVGFIMRPASPESARCLFLDVGKLVRANWNWQSASGIFGALA